MENFLDRAIRYRNRAEEMRAIADSMNSPQSRESFINIAEQYERMAQSAQSTWDMERAAKALVARGGAGRDTRVGRE